MPPKKRRIPIVLNTSVIISHLYGGTARKVVELWKHGHLQLIVSPEIVAEYLRILQKSPLLTERGFQALRLWFSHKSKARMVWTDVSPVVACAGVGQLHVFPIG